MGLARPEPLPAEIVPAGQTPPPDRFLLVDESGMVLWENPSGWGTGAKLQTFVHPSTRGLFDAVLADHAAGGTASQDVTCLVADERGRWRQAEIGVAPMPGSQPERYLVTIRTPHSERHTPADLVRRATEDNLTGLSNRSTLLTHLRAAEGAGDAGPLAVLYLDVDHFKQVNDAHGHAAGDAVLVAVADRLRTAVRPGDLISRIGGDEFVVVAGGVGDGDTATTIAERIRAGMVPPISAGGRSITATVSIGVAIGPRRWASSLLEQADGALYRAKDLGRDRVVLYELGHGDFRPGRLSAEEILREALDRDRLVIVYEPVVELATGRTVIRATSTRLRGDDGRLESSDAMLRLATQSGLIVPLGAGVLDRACADAAAWRQGDEAAPGVSWSMAAGHLEEPWAAEQVLSVLKSHGLTPESLSVEVAERSLLRPATNTRRNLDGLRERGVRLIVADFGEHLANLSVLQAYAFDALKLDPGLMAGFVRDNRHTAIVEGIIAMGKSLGVTVLAQGVEYGAQAYLLERMGCDWAQGSHFGSPVPREQLPALGSASG